MGRMRKGHNWKARLEKSNDSTTKSDKSVSQSQSGLKIKAKPEAVVVESEGTQTFYKSSVDGSNQLVVSGKKERAKESKV